MIILHVILVSVWVNLILRNKSARFNSNSKFEHAAILTLINAESQHSNIILGLNSYWKQLQYRNFQGWPAGWNCFQCSCFFFHFTHAVAYNPQSYTNTKRGSRFISCMNTNIIIFYSSNRPYRLLWYCNKHMEPLKL